MHTVGAYEAKTHFSSLLEEVEKGGHVMITKHGHPVAKLIPASSVDKEKTKLAIEKLKNFCRSQCLNGVDWKELRDEGRR